MDEFYQRHLQPRIQDALADTPVVFINGPRQCGKTTLVRQCLPDVPYFTLDDDTLLGAVQADPTGFVRNLDRAVIDEAQRAPALLRAIKIQGDQDRRPGRFLLTGSANLLALPRVSESLAGRMEVLNLLPLSQAEIDRRENSFLEQAASQRWQAPPTLHLGPALIGRVLGGGYPEMLRRSLAARRQAWATAYVHALIERDIQDIAEIQRRDVMPRLLAVLAQMTGQLTNFTQIGGQLGLDTKTTQKYVGLLEQVFLVSRVPPWGRNELGRLVKTPKLHFLDAGLQARLVRLTLDRAAADRMRFGATLETWVFGELRKALSLSDENWSIFHYRDKDQAEVDFVLENGLLQVIGVEVKAAATVTAADFKGLHRLAAATGKQFLSGLVLYDGERAVPFGSNMWAVPLSSL